MTWSAVLHYLAVILRKPSKQLNYFLFTNLSYVVRIILHILIAFYHYIHLKGEKYILLVSPAVFTGLHAWGIGFSTRHAMRKLSHRLTSRVLLKGQ
jgi:hypothetical protein